MNFFKRNINILSRGFKDIKAYFDFKKTVKAEINDGTSLLNKYNLEANSSYTRISRIVEIPDDYAKAANSHQKSLLLKDLVTPINQYLEFELNWAEYLILEFYSVIDENGNPTANYVASWVFSPICLNRFVFWRNVAVCVLMLAGITFGVFKLISLI